MTNTPSFPLSESVKRGLFQISLISRCELIQHHQRRIQLWAATKENDLDILTNAGEIGNGGAFDQGGILNINTISDTARSTRKKWPHAEGMVCNNQVVGGTFCEHVEHLADVRGDPAHMTRIPSLLQSDQMSKGKPPSKREPHRSHHATD